MNVYKVEQDNRMRKCLTTSETQILLKELHEGMVGEHFVVDIIAKKILFVKYWWLILFKDTSLPNNIVILVFVNNFEPNPILVNVNTLKPYTYVD
jgi:hypothetical protein